MKKLLFLALALTNVPVHAMLNWDTVKNKANSFLLHNSDKVAMGSLGVAAALTLLSMENHKSSIMLAGVPFALCTPFIAKNYGSYLSGDNFYKLKVVSNCIGYSALICAVFDYGSKYLINEELTKINPAFITMFNYMVLPVYAATLTYLSSLRGYHNNFRRMADNPVIAIKRIESFINLLTKDPIIDLLTNKPKEYLTIDVGEHTIYSHNLLKFLTISRENKKLIPKAYVSALTNFPMIGIQSCCQLVITLCKNFMDCKKNLAYCDQETRDKYTQLLKRIEIWYETAHCLDTLIKAFPSAAHVLYLAPRNSRSLNAPPAIRAALKRADCDLVATNVNSDKGNQIIRAVKIELQGEITKLLTGKRV